MPEIMPLQPSDAVKWLPQLIILLQDAVDSGASVGFLAPLAEVDAYHYWMKAFVQLSAKSRIILAAVQDGTIVIQRLVQEHREYLLRSWDEYFND